MKSCDVVIIGAGPAGMSAATETARAGLSTLVLDEQPQPGGQIYRGIERASAERLRVLGEDYGNGRRITEGFRASGATYVPGTTVWNIDREKVVNYSTGDGSRQISARSLVVATGAIERPTPLPGWTLPGVMTAGACQILLKAHGIADGDVVFVGCGPLMWLIASQLIQAGVAPKAIVETVPRKRYVAAARKLPPSLGALGYLRKGAAMIRAVKRAGVPVYRDASGIAVEGTTEAEAVTFTSAGRSLRIGTGRVALHQGVVPNQQVTRLLHCRHRWDESQHCFVPDLNERGETSLADVYVAGDGGGIRGAAAAALQGRLVGLHIAEKAGRPGRTSCAEVEKALKRDAAIRPFLEALYAPSSEILAPAAETVICRCEEITAGQIREAVELGAPGPNQVKSYLRSGMGPCQGRMCGLAVAEIIAECRGEPQEAVGYYRIRPPLKPLPLTELASMETDETDPSETKSSEPA